MQVELLYITPNAEKLIEKIGRICYKSENRITKYSYKKFIKNLIQKGHTSVLEHAVASFKITGVSRIMTHQLVRHRLASYTQVSNRYTTAKNYIIPDSIKQNKELLNKYIALMNNSFKLYNELINNSIKKEDARFILPQCIQTEIIMTANFREWRHILELRLHKSAQWEIRKTMQEILKILYNNSPVIFEDIINK